MMFRILGLIAFLAMLVNPMSAQTSFCAFKVQVTTPSGAPVSKIPVLLIVKPTTVFAQGVTDAAGVIELCDAPIGALDIVVGRDVCGAVRVGNLHIAWPGQQVVHVAYADHPCDHFSVSPECLVLLRIRADDGAPIAGASLDQGPGVAPGSSDTYGRIFRLLSKGDRLEGSIVKSGYVSAQFSEVCTDNMERPILLRKR